MVDLSLQIWDMGTGILNLSTELMFCQTLTDFNFLKVD